MALPRLLSCVVACTLLLPAADAGLFDVPEPQLIYEGSAPGLGEGVLVIRRAEDFDRAIDLLDPGFGAQRPDMRKLTVLRIVGRPRPDACHDTVLKSVSTRNLTATVELEQRVPAADCPCSGPARPPRAWLLTVARVVRRARTQITDVVVPCSEARQTAEPDGPALLLQGSWDHDPGGEILDDAKTYRAALARLGAGKRGPEVDFNTHQVLVVTGRPRQNGCRKTRVVEVDVTGAEATVTVEEIYPGKGQMCTQLFTLPKAFVYRIPRGVRQIRVTTREVRGSGP
ncbi:MAG: hypothetical protein Q9Q40_08855 [Acidobacteriota bacterium]|nr:hypothetical protein [Acidobacteriota bacterium]MDQ7088990.1 hypothetical protein [Acidobacteriota bacterium]